MPELQETTGFSSSKLRWSKQASQPIPFLEQKVVLVWVGQLGVSLLVGQLGGSVLLGWLSVSMLVGWLSVGGTPRCFSVGRTAWCLRRLQVLCSPNRLNRASFDLCWCSSVQNDMLHLLAGLIL